MLKILKYSLSDLLRSWWTYAYLLFYLLLGFVLLFLNNDVSKAIITLMNVIIILTPLIASIFGIMYYYNSAEFTELLLAQPLHRNKIILGQYLGVSLSLCFSMLIGLGLPFVLYGLLNSSAVSNFVLLLITGAFLHLIFVALAYNVGISNDNKIKGFSLTIFIWLLLAVIYDGIFLILVFYLNEYPLDKFTLGAMLFNPIDLSRVLILLKLDISALMGYTGAVFKSFFGTSKGFVIAFISLCLWVFIPLLRLVYKLRKKDF